MNESMNEGVHESMNMTAKSIYNTSYSDIKAYTVYVDNAMFPH